MKKIIILLILLLLSSFCALSQDVVYDAVMGNKSYWRRIKVGPEERILNTYFQNIGVISKSKILMAAGIWDGMVENVDYEIMPLNYDTIVFEFKSNELLNLNLYKYVYNENYYYNFIGLRRANLGDDLFTGKYLFICPIPPGSQIYVYKGIGDKRKLFLTIYGNEITENTYTDYDVTDEITFKVIKGQKRLMHAIIREFIIDENDYESRIVVWPNPVRDILHIKILENPGLILRIYNAGSALRYEGPIDSEETTINMSSYLSGIYILVFTDKNNISILHTIKVIKK